MVSMRTTLFTIFGFGVATAYVGLLWLLASLSVLIVALIGVPLSLVFAFMSRQLAREPDYTDSQRLMMIPLMPFAILAGLVVIGFLFLLVAVTLPVGLLLSFLHERRLHRQMRSKGRLLTMAELRPKLQAGEGTLIEDIGHKVPYRVWWTADRDQLNGATVLTRQEIISIIQGQDHTENARRLKEYLDPATGKAFLTTIRRRHTRSATLREMFPRMPVAVIVRPRVPLNNRE
jgi:hypothetical protein